MELLIICHGGAVWVLPLVCFTEKNKNKTGEIYPQPVKFLIFGAGKYYLDDGRS